MPAHCGPITGPTRTIVCPVVWKRPLNETPSRSPSTDPFLGPRHNDHFVKLLLGGGGDIIGPSERASPRQAIRAVCSFRLAPGLSSEKTRNPPIGGAKRNAAPFNLKFSADTMCVITRDLLPTVVELFDSVGRTSITHFYAAFSYIFQSTVSS